MDDITLAKIGKAVKELPEQRTVPAENVHKAQKEMCHKYCKYYGTINMDRLLDDYCCHCPLFALDQT